MSDVGATGATDTQTLQRMLELHADRVAAYNAWHEAFRVYLLDEQGKQTRFFRMQLLRVDTHMQTHP